MALNIPYPYPKSNWSLQRTEDNLLYLSVIKLPALASQILLNDSLMTGHCSLKQDVSFACSFVLQNIVVVKQAQSRS